MALTQIKTTGIADNAVTDAKVVDAITSSNHLPLAGGTMTGALNMNSQNITNAGTIQGTLSTASQTNITSVGTLTSLTLGGDLLVPQYIKHVGDTDCHIEFGTDEVKLRTGDSSRLIARNSDVEIYSPLVATSATFSGTITANTGSKITSSSADTTFKIETTSGTSIFPVLDFVSSHSSVGGKIRQDGSDVITIDNDQDVTFADDITVSGNATFEGGTTTLPVGGILRFGERGNLTHHNTSYDMTFNTNSTANAMVIKGTGNVAIGGTGGYQKLSVESGNIYMTAGYAITWANGNATIDESGYALRFNTYDNSTVSNALTLAGNNNATFAGHVTMDGATNPIFKIVGDSGGESSHIQLHRSNGQGFTIYDTTASLAFRADLSSSNPQMLQLKSDQSATFFGDIVRSSNDYTSRIISGFTTGNASVSATFPIQDNSSVLVTAMFTHYGAGINSYGCVRMVWVSCRDNSQSLHNINEITSTNGGSWGISTSSSVVTVTKSAGTYVGGGHYWIKIEGSANI